MLAEYQGWKQRLREAAAKDPVDSLLATVLGGALLFYYAEKGNNPKVESYYDALVYVSTCVSVGYADIFPKTPTGKAIASALMAFGPAIAAAALEPPSAERQPEPADPRLIAVQEKMSATLDAILAELGAQPPSRQPLGP
jgi:hypothetical protein